MHLLVIILVAVVLGFVLGTIAYDKLHTQVAEKFAADKAALTYEYNTLIARAHAERDRLFALIHPPRPPATPPPPPPVVQADAAPKAPPPTQPST